MLYAINSVFCFEKSEGPSSLPYEKASYLFPAANLIGDFLVMVYGFTMLFKTALDISSI